MIPAGTSLTHPRSGDRFVFLSEPEDWVSQRLRLRMLLSPGNRWAPPHYHTEYDETLRVEAGRLEVRIRNVRWTVTPEDGAVLIPRGVVHAFWNPSASTTTLYAELSPCFDLERGILAAYGMARDGRSSRWDLPYNPLELGLLLHLLKSHSPWLPLSIQGAFAKSCCRLAEALGRRVDFPEYGAEQWPGGAAAQKALSPA
jgi:mannose-6-phosphate isomerase-like protein (cupin superfamily)